MQEDAVSNDTFFVTMKYEVPMQFISDLRLMQLEDGPDAIAECLATLQGRRVVGVELNEANGLPL